MELLRTIDNGHTILLDTATPTTLIGESAPECGDVGDVDGPDWDGIVENTKTTRADGKPFEMKSEESVHSFFLDSHRNHGTR
jgi:hypothetical protein